MAYCCLTRVFGSSKTTKCAKVHWEKIIFMVVGLKCRTSTTGLSKPWWKTYVMACQPRHGCFLKGKLATTTCVASQFHQKQKVYPENTIWYNLYIVPTAERPTTSSFPYTIWFGKMEPYESRMLNIIGLPTPIKNNPGKHYMQCRMLQNEYIQHHSTSVFLISNVFPKKHRRFHNNRKQFMLLSFTSESPPWFVMLKSRGAVFVSTRWWHL